MNFLATALCILVIVVAYKGASPWWVLAFAIGSTSLYLAMRRENFARFGTFGYGVVARWVALTYILQVVTMAILFLVGWAIAKVAS